MLSFSGSLQLSSRGSPPSSDGSRWDPDPIPAPTGASDRHLRRRRNPPTIALEARTIARQFYRSQMNQNLHLTVEGRAERAKGDLKLTLYKDPCPPQPILPGTAVDLQSPTIRTY